MHDLSLAACINPAFRPATTAADGRHPATAPECLDELQQWPASAAARAPSLLRTHTSKELGLLPTDQNHEDVTMTPMKAAICTRYGPPEVLIVREVDKPQPKANELLVRVHASTVNSSDWFIRSGIPNEPAFTRLMMKLMIGVRRPRRQILGLIVAGEVVEVGAAVTRFGVGDRVFAFTKFHLGG